ncbi:sensor protein SrrB [Flavobacterium succinicans]|uniref:histidine kinase n=2 Tax=Flavobacterium succinicans TaxID=29536 RepID=A0A199XNX1_9FLAO|nr:sensor protein SrrB [Flavobacterium succinicans]
MCKRKHYIASIFFFQMFFTQISLYPNDFLNKNLMKKAIKFKSQTNFNRAQFYFLKKNWDSTLVYSMKQINSNFNKELTDYCHYFRANAFYYKNLYKESKKELLLISNSKEIYPLKKIMLGKNSIELGLFNEAILHYKEIESISKKESKLYSLGDIYEGIGVAYLFLNEYKKSEKYLNKNLLIREKEGNFESIYSSHNIIANLYYMQEKNEEANIYFKKAYLAAQNLNDFEKKSIVAKNLSIIEEDFGNLNKALIYRKEYEQWKDSLYNQNKIWAVAEYEKKYAVAQKQKQISVLKVENELKNTQRNTMFFSTIGLLLLLTGGVYIYGQKEKNTKIILSQKEKLDELNATKDQLFSIVSHDLRSSVNALKTSNTKLTSSLESKNYDELDRLLHQNSAIANSAYSLLDNLLHWALLQTQQLYFHKDSVHLFSIVQQIEYSYKPLLLEKTIAFENEVSKNGFIFVDLDSLKIILRNLLDNAIKFSPEHSSIRFYSLDTPSEFHQLIIEDQGIGMRPETIAELLQDNELLAKKSNSEIIGTGLGMQLCKQMIKKNGGTLAIESELNKGTKMILSFPKTV